MRRLYPPALSAKTCSTLSDQQQRVDAMPTYAKRVSQGKALWKSKTSSKVKKRAFAEVRETLKSMSHGQRCHYCEDSMADEIEHIWPKDLYPERTFQWENYVYACGPCNGPKSNKFSVLDHTLTLHDVTRARKAPVVPPVKGNPALINPREEDPLSFLHLDLRDTFYFIPFDDTLPEAQQDAARRLRAEYTIDVLRLNVRSALVEQRRLAFEVFAALLFRYGQLAQLSTTPEDTLRTIREHVVRLAHQSVWLSMQLQARDARAPGEVLQLFARAPGAIEW